MLTTTKKLLSEAQSGHYAIGAFNIYNLEGVRAVVEAAEEARSPALLQLLPGALRYGGMPLVALIQEAIRGARVPLALHLDHSSAAPEIELAIGAAFSSLLADGSHLELAANVKFTRWAVEIAHRAGLTVEAELGRLTGTEDGITIPEYEARLTDPELAVAFVAETGVDFLAVCIGNVHGRYAAPPQLDFERLARLRERVGVPLVLHGASGLPGPLIQQAIDLGVCKFNVNTEVREAFVGVLRHCGEGSRKDLLEILGEAITRMRVVVTEKLVQFGSAGRAVV